MKMRPGLDKYLARVGATSGAQLAWVFRWLNLYRADEGKDWLPGDWDNVSRELAVFSGYGKALHGWGGVPLENGEIVERPSQKEAGVILASFQQMVENAEHHQTIHLPTFEMKQELRWHQQLGRYFLCEEPFDEATWEDRARYALAHRLKEEAHRVQRCPAKLPHEGKRCAAFFLKSKRQKFCSKTCTSREMTRAKRQRDERTPQARVKKGASHGRKNLR